MVEHWLFHMIQPSFSLMEARLVSWLVCNMYTWCSYATIHVSDNFVVDFFTVHLIS